MSDFPLQHIEIEDFRRLNGIHSYALDAPIVLIHGPNGSGKTSILSALELGLTGQVTGLDQDDDEQFKHLPFTDATGATVRVDVRPDLARHTDRERVTVSRTRGFSGPPAFRAAEARFYRERCYLDQASLGRLLEIYQDTDKAKESVLSRFVNELLGLEELDALRDGLFDATNITKLRKRATELGQADQYKKDAELRRTERTRGLTDAQNTLAKARAAAVAALDVLGYTIAPDEPNRNLLDTASTASNDDLFATKEAIAAVHREIIEIGGHLNAVSLSGNGQQLAALDATATTAEAAHAAWVGEHQTNVDDWDQAAASLEIRSSTADREAAVRDAITETRLILETQAALRERLESAEAEYSAATTAADAAQAAYDKAREHASTLVEGLVALRPLIDSPICPVCERDYTEVGADLGGYVDIKIRRLTEHSQRLMELRNERDMRVAELSRHEREVGQLSASRLSPDVYQQAVERDVALGPLAEELNTLQPLIDEGQRLAVDAESSRRAYRDLNAALSVTHTVAERLSQLEAVLGIDPDPNSSLREQQERLSQQAAAEVETLDRNLATHHRLTSAVASLAEAIDREHEASRLVSQASQEVGYWEERVKEGAKRHKIAKELHEAADKARSSIIQRVFTTDLNTLWRDLFTRLAPNETYVPAFGTVTSNKSVEPKLITHHKNGDTSGTPRLMLSAGNLNTAALSLFLALHLSVKNAVPCLVFDDPVQAMDEVHISQFAALIRTLSKDLNRQVVIAVHERELFDYLALELSPAYPGDELITIRLGDDSGSTRIPYTPDTSIAV